MQCNQPIKNRIARCEGQMRGVIKMMEQEGQDCKQVLTQLSAIRSSIDKIITLIAVNNIKEMYESSEKNEENIQQAVDLLLKCR